jgi:thymidylate synthase ThyX
MEKIKFPMKIRFNEKPTSRFLTEKEAIKVTMIAHPENNFRENCYRMIMSTWNDKPIKKINKTDVNKVFVELLKGKTLPNSMESLIFTFLIEGLTHVEISHLLRHRAFFSIHALCSGDRDLRHDDIMIPESIMKSHFYTQYVNLSIACKDLYSKMVDSKDISLMDARYILNRNHLYYYYVSMNLKDAIAFINQRKCSMIQPFTDNLLAEKIYKNIIKIIPELKNIISLKCDKRCHFITSAKERNTRLYQPDKNHSKLFEYNHIDYLYDKTRHEMGVPEWVQDK